MSKAMNLMTKNRARGPLSMTASGVGLIAAKAASMGLGFVFWMVAARNFSVEEVGLVGAAIPAIQLTGQAALLGLGAAFTIFYSRAKDTHHLLNTSLTTTSLLSLFSVSLFAAYAAFISSELRALVESPVFLVLFLAMGVGAGLMLIVDQISMAMRRGDQIIGRSLLNGVVSIVPLLLLGWAGVSMGATELFGVWVMGSFAGIALALFQISRTMGGHHYRLELDRGLARNLIKVGAPNYLLTLIIRLPAFVLPIVVAEVISPEANAFWYPLWMVAWAAFVIPYALSVALFAEGAHDPSALASNAKRMITASLTLGAVAAVAILVAANWVLGLLGTDYADGGASTLRILVIAVLPQAFVSAYTASCRATNRIREATVVVGAQALVAIAGAIVAARVWGLEGVAWMYVAGTAVAAVPALLRLRHFSQPSSSPEATDQPGVDSEPAAREAPLP